MDSGPFAQSIDWKKAKRFVGFCLALLAIFWLFAQIYHALLAPIGISLFLSYLLAPLVETVHRFRIPRGVVVSVILLVALSSIGIAMIKVVPSLYNEIVELMRLAPKVYDTFTSTWLPSIRDWLVGWGLISADEFEQWLQESRTIIHFSERINQALTTLLQTAPQVLGTVINIVMVPLLTFFLLKDYEVIKSRFLALVPRDLQEPWLIFALRLSRALRAVIRGQAMVAAILACLYILGLSLAGLQSAVAIGLLAGFFRLIPYFDVLVGGTLCMIAVLSDFQGIGQLLAVMGVFVAVQSLDGMLITPRVIGDRVGLHPLVVIVSVLAFGDLYGFWGILLVIPVLAIVKVLWLSIKPFYLASKAYQGHDQPQGSE